MTTVEALAGDALGRALMQAFDAEQAGQCGYCLSGILVVAYALLKRQPDADRPSIVQALDDNLCRCGAHLRIIRAVERAAASFSGDGVRP